MKLSNYLVKAFVGVIIIIALTVVLTSCNWAEGNSIILGVKGSIKGCTYNCMFFDNSGDLYMTVVGDNINMESNIINEKTYTSDGGWENTKTLSSVITLQIDGKEMETCGSTVIFAQDDLKPDVDFTYAKDVLSESTGSLTQWSSISALVNSFKNSFGKPRVVVIQSQLGVPICAYSGDDVYWEVAEDLPKTTKIMIDGKALYIHRANFNIIDKDLLNE